MDVLRCGNQLLVMHHDELRERGRHEELLAKGGLQARLHRPQFRDEEEDEVGAAG